jgi:hypothetical protein
VRNQESTLLSLPVYNDLFKSIAEPNLENIRSLSEVLPHDREELSKISLSLFMNLMPQNCHLQTLTTLAQQEIAQLEDPHIIFRGNSIATKMLDAFMKECGRNYLAETIGGLLKAVLNFKESCEVDPLKIPSSTSTPTKSSSVSPTSPNTPNTLETSEILSRNWKNLIHIVDVIWKSISESASKCPR